jgi:hypothetical protein
MPHCLLTKVGLLGAHKSTLLDFHAHATPPALLQATHRANAHSDPCWDNNGYKTLAQISVHFNHGSVKRNFKI